MTKQQRLTTSRLGRLSMIGRLAGGLAGGMVSEGARRLAAGQRPSIGDMLLTTDNLNRLGERLSEMRGAAMKVGQLLSMDSGEVLPAEISQTLARLREDAHHMPLGQVAEVLEAAWGSGWDRQFTRFSFTPIAAASIGQVHVAELKGGPRVAIKIQYPGIRRSIDSDVDNVATLLRMSRLLPDGMDIAPLLNEAKQQLHVEADYEQEAASLRAFAQRLDGDDRYAVPTVISELSDADVLTMGYMDGQPIDSLHDSPAEVRDAVGARLTELALRELLDWGLVQTDPNFANFLYDPGKQRIQLLDFGATRVYPPARRGAIRSLLAASLDGDDGDVASAAVAVGYLDPDDPTAYRDAIIRLLRTATLPVREPQPYRFGSGDIAQQMSDVVVDMRMRSGFTRLPPTDILFLHRKLGGLYLLLTRLGARVALDELLSPYRQPDDGAAPALEQAIA